MYNCRIEPIPGLIEEVSDRDFPGIHGKGITSERMGQDI